MHSLTEISDLRILLECLVELSEYESVEATMTQKAIHERLNNQTAVLIGKVGDLQTSGKSDEARLILAQLYCESSLNSWAKRTGGSTEPRSPDPEQPIDFDLREDVSRLISHHFEQGDTASALRLQEDLTEFNVDAERAELIAGALTHNYEEFITRVEQLSSDWKIFALVAVIRRVVEKDLWCQRDVIGELLCNSMFDAPRTRVTDLAMATAIRHDSADAVEILQFENLHSLTFTKASWSTLHLAARYNSHRAAKTLLRNGIRPDILDHSNSTPLHIACSHQAMQVAFVLINKGASVNAVNNRQHTPLISVLDWKEPMLPDLHELQAQFIMGLLHNGAEPHLGQGPNVLSTAIQHSSPTIVKLIGRSLQSHHRLNGNDALFGHSLHLAIQSLRIDNATVLLELGVDVTKLDNEGKTPLHHAAKLQSPSEMEFIDEMLDKGAPINAQDFFGYTPLHCAVQEANLSAAKHLLLAGASIVITDVAGHTPYSVARLAWNGPMAELLGRWAHGLSAFH